MSLEADGHLRERPYTLTGRNAEMDCSPASCKIKKQKSQSWETSKGSSLTLWWKQISKGRRELSWQGLHVESRGLCLLTASSLSSLWRRPSSLLCGDLHMAHHGCRPQIAILSWSQINQSLLEKYLVVRLFSVVVSVLSPRGTAT